ncbi:hypothetical protein ON010_g12734 [Phytophthora cinnamomi]|nr:hypothetical protein ON010_g12734 [Phytophthora cinnamomi]
MAGGTDGRSRGRRFQKHATWRLSVSSEDEFTQMETLAALSQCSAPILMVLCKAPPRRGALTLVSLAGIYIARETELASGVRYPRRTDRERRAPMGTRQSWWMAAVVGESRARKRWERGAICSMLPARNSMVRQNQTSLDRIIYVRRACHCIIGAGGHNRSGLAIKVGRASPDMTETGCSEAFPMTFRFFSKSLPRAHVSSSERVDLATVATVCYLSRTIRDDDGLSLLHVQSCSVHCLRL